MLRQSVRCIAAQTRVRMQSAHLCNVGSPVAGSLCLLLLQFLLSLFVLLAEPVKLILCALRSRHSP